MHRMGLAPTLIVLVAGAGYPLYLLGIAKDITAPQTTTLDTLLSNLEGVSTYRSEYSNTTQSILTTIGSKNG